MHPPVEDAIRQGNALRPEWAQTSHKSMIRNSLVLVVLAAVCPQEGVSAPSYHSEVVPSALLAEHKDSKVLTTDYSHRIDDALKRAGDNRGELLRVLEHYRETGEHLKRKAAEYLIASMRSHSFVRQYIVNGSGEEIPFDSLQCKDFAAAEAARNELHRAHPEAKYKADVVRDLESIKAGQLIAHIDLAMTAWQTRPWAEQVTFDVFCDYILPYRGSSEPIQPWRKACMDELDTRMKKITGPIGHGKLRELFYETRESWVRFETKAYLHPTDQGFDDMRLSGVGRCEDLSNMFIYLGRSIGVPTTSDYTPAWPRGDNNHNWEVILDGNGKVIERPDFPDMAKVYRNMYAEQEGLPKLNRLDGEEVPGWLANRCYLDVTTEYKPDAKEITIQLTERIPEKCSWAYLAVFNSDEWVPLAAGRMDRETRGVTFQAMGRNIMYRPVYCVAGKDGKQELLSAAPIVILGKDGTTRILNQPADRSGPMTKVEISQTKDVQINPDTGKPENTLQVEPQKEYELFYFDGDWASLGRKRSTKESLVYDNLPPGRLYRLCEIGGKGSERPFTVENGKAVLW